MIKITKYSPSLIQVEGCSPEQIEKLRSELSYNDRKATFMYKKFKNNKYFAMSLDREDYEERLEHLKENIKKVLIGKNKEGKLVTYSGLLHRIQDILFDTEFEDLTVFTESELIAFEDQPPQMRYYQAKAVDALLEQKHGAVSICTGGGKSLVILNLAKRLGLKTTIFCPSSSIADQLYSDFIKYFGKKNVGLFGSGKREYNKLFTIAIDKSLINVKKGTPEYEALSSTKVAIVDESHMVATESQKNIMLGLLKTAPYRFFLSATQFRADGSDLLLEGITGPLVYNYPIKQAIAEGYLAAPTFYIIPIEYKKRILSKDALRVLDEAVYKNKGLHEAAAKLANKYIESNKKVMVMIDRVEQFKLLMNHFCKRPGFAFGSLTAKQKKGIPVEYHKMKSVQNVKDFNDGKIDLLVGTTAISMGTDIRPVDVIINLQGGQSDVKFLQLIGRGTRKAPGKETFIFIDFDVIDVDILHRWSLSRERMFLEITDEVINCS
jgi:superfamily II DNA or RNA helicase